MAKPRKPRKPGKKIIKKRVNVSLRNKAGATARGRRMAAVLGPTSGYEGHETIETVVDVPGSAAAKDRALKQGGKKQGGKKQGTPKAVAKARAKNAANRPTAADRPATANRRPDATRQGRGTRTEGTQGRAAKTMASRPVGNMGRDEFTTEYRAALTAAREGEPGAAARVRQLREHGKRVGYLGNDGKPARPARDRDAAAEKAPDTAGGDRKPPTTPPAAPAATGDQPERPRPQDDGPTENGPTENGPTEGYDEFELEEQWIEASANNHQHELADTADEPHDPAQFREAALQMRDTDLEAEWAELEQDLIDLGDPPRMDTPEDVAALDAAIDAALAYGAELDARNNEANPFHADAPDLDTDGVDMPNTRPGDEAEWLTGLDDDELERVIRDAKPELRDMADEEMERRYPWREDGVLQRMLSHRTMTDIRREQKRLLGDDGEVYDKNKIYELAGIAGNYRYVAHAEPEFMGWLQQQASEAAITTVTDAKHQQDLDMILASGVDKIGSPIMMQSMPREVRDAATRLGFIPNRANWARIQRGEAPLPYNGELTMKRMYGRKKRRSKDEILRDMMAKENRRAARDQKARDRDAQEWLKAVEEAEPGWTLTPEQARDAVTEAEEALIAGGGDPGKRDLKNVLYLNLVKARGDRDMADAVAKLRGERDGTAADTAAARRTNERGDTAAAAANVAREQGDTAADAARRTNERDTNADAEKAATDRNKTAADARKQRATANATDGEEVTEQGNIRRGNALMWENRDGTYSVQPIDGERVPRGKGMKADTLDDARRMADRIGAGEVPNERTADNAGKKKIGKPGPNAKTVDPNAKAEKPKPAKAKPADATAKRPKQAKNTTEGDTPASKIDSRERGQGLEGMGGKATNKRHTPGTPFKREQVMIHEYMGGDLGDRTIATGIRQQITITSNPDKKNYTVAREINLGEGVVVPVSEDAKTLPQARKLADKWDSLTGRKDMLRKALRDYNDALPEQVMRESGQEKVIPGGIKTADGDKITVDKSGNITLTRASGEKSEHMSVADARAMLASETADVADAAKRAKSTPKAKPAGKTKPVKNWRSELTTADGDMPLVESAPNMSDDDLVTAYKGLSADVRRYRAEATKHRKAKNTYDARSATREGDRYETQRSQIGEQLRRRGFKLNALDKGRQNGTTERGDRDAKSKSDAANQQRKDAARVTHVGDRLNAGADLEGLTDDDLRNYRAALDAAPETTRNTVPENITRNLAAEEKRRGLDGATADTTPAQKPTPKAKPADAKAADAKAAADDLMQLPQRERDIAVYNDVQGETYTTAEVAEMTGLTPAQARATLSRLEANGLVFRSDDNDDQGLGSRRNVSGGRTSMDNLAWTDAYRDDDGAVADAVNAYDPKMGAERPAPAKKATAKKPAPAKKATAKKPAPAKKATDTPTVDPKKQQRAADAAEKHAKAEKAHATATAKVDRAMRENTTDRINADTETAAINATKAFIRERNAKAAQLRAEIAANPDKDTPEARKAITDAEKATKGAKVNNIGSKEFKAVKADIIAAAEAKRPAIGKPTPKKDPVDEPDMTPQGASDMFDAVLAEVARKKAENGGVMPTDPEFERRQKNGLGRGEVLPGTLKPGDHVITPYGKARVKRVNLNNVVVENPVTADTRRPLPDVDDLAVFRYDHIAVPPGSDAAFREPDTTGLREGTAKIGDYPTVGLGRAPQRSDYYTTAELEERGWTRAKLKDIVGKPDGVKKFREKIAADGDGSQRGDYSGYNVNLYSRARIDLAEADYPDEDFGPHRAPEVPTIEGLDIDRVATEAGRTIFPITNAKDLAGDADLSSAWLDTKGKLNVRGDDKARDRIQAVIDNGPPAAPDARMSGMAEPGSALTPDGVADAKKQAAETTGADLPAWFPAALGEVEGKEGSRDPRDQANTRILNNRAMREGIVKSDDGHTIDEDQRVRFAAVEKLSDKDLKALAADRNKGKPNHVEATLESVRRGNFTSRRTGPTDVEKLIGGIAFGDIDPGDVSLTELKAISDYSGTFNFDKQRNNSWHFVSDIVGWAGVERTRIIGSDVESNPGKYLDLIRNNEAMPEGVDPNVVAGRLKSLSSTDYGSAVEQGRVNALKFDADPKYRDLVDDNTGIGNLTDSELDEAHRLYRENNPATGNSVPTVAEKKFADTLAALTQEQRDRQLERESKGRGDADAQVEETAAEAQWENWTPSYRSVPMEELPDAETFTSDANRVPTAADQRYRIHDALDAEVETKRARALELRKSKDNSREDMDAYARAYYEADEARIARLTAALEYETAREEIVDLLRKRAAGEKMLANAGFPPLPPRRTLGDYLDDMGVPGGRTNTPDARMSGMAEPGSVLTPNGVETAAPSIRDQIRDIVSPGGKVSVERRKAERESPLGVKRAELVARMKSHPEKDTMPPSSRSLEWHQLNAELAETELAGDERRLAQIEQDIADFKSKGATDKDLFTLNARQKATRAAVDKSREQAQTARKQASAKGAEQTLAADAKKPADLTTKAPGGNKWEVTKRDEYPIKSTKIGPDKKSPEEVAQWLAEFATTFKGDRKSDESISIQFQDAMVGAWAREGNTADVDFYLGMFARGTDVQDAEFMVGTPGVAAIDAEKLARTRSAKSARKIIDEGIAKETKQVGSRLARDIMLDESRNDPRELVFTVFALTDGNIRDKYGRVPKDANAEEARLAANIAERLHRVDPDRLGYGFDGVAQSFREVANQIDPDGAPTPAETLDPRSNERIMRETARAELGTDGDLVIEHTPEGGTLIHGTSRGDGTGDVLKANGWRWSRNLGAWYVPRTRDQRPDGNKIDRTATALEADGHKVGTDLDDTVRSAAEREAAKAERADDRAEALANKADRKRAAADTAWQKDKAATDRVPPMGEPVKVGHHSERGHRRAIDRAWQTLGNALEAEKDAKETDRRAKVAARANDARNNPVTVARRIDGLEADIRKMERARVTGPELDTARDDLTYWRGVHDQYVADGKIASQNPDDYKPGMFLVQNRRLYRIAKVNKKTLSVETEGPTEGKPSVNRVNLNQITGSQLTPEEADAMLREQVAGMSDDDLRNKIGYNRSVHSYGQRDAMKAELARREGTEPPAPEMPLTPPGPGEYEKHQRGRILKRHVKVDEGETLAGGKIKRGDFTIAVDRQRGYTVTDAAGNSSLGEHGQRFDIDLARERVDAMQADRDLLGRDSEVLGLTDDQLRERMAGYGDTARDATDLLIARAENLEAYVDNADEVRAANRRARDEAQAAAKKEREAEATRAAAAKARAERHATLTKEAADLEEKLTGQKAALEQHRANFAPKKFGSLSHVYTPEQQAKMEKDIADAIAATERKLAANRVELADIEKATAPAAPTTPGFVPPGSYIGENGIVTPETTTPESITLEYDAHGNVDRRQVLAAFADGVYVNQVFGPDRPRVAQSIAAHVRGIMPTKAEVTRAAYGYGDERRINAYRNGREYLLSAYSGYVSPDDFPSLDSDDLPEGE